MPSGRPGVDEAIRAAIGDKRPLSFDLKGLPRIAEPHDYGVIKGEYRLFFYQGFAGSRPAPTGRHAHWDELIATVSPRS